MIAQPHHVGETGTCDWPVQENPLLRKLGEGEGGSQKPGGMLGRQELERPLV